MHDAFFMHLVACIVAKHLWTLKTPNQKDNNPKWGNMDFFDFWTSKSGANMWCFEHFDFEMCFSPQRRALFRHLNFQKWSDNGEFCAFWFRNVLRATTACAFSTSQLPKEVRHWGVLYILTSKCASRHNGVQFFISHLASWLRIRRFSEPTFPPSGAPNHWKNTVFRNFPTFSRICIFFLLTLSLLLFSLPCSSSVHFVGSLTSKFPSVIYQIYIYINISIYIYINQIISLRKYFPIIIY